jgi:hypothetical protein
MLAALEQRLNLAQRDPHRGGWALRESFKERAINGVHGATLRSGAVAV